MSGRSWCFNEVRCKASDGETATIFLNDDFRCLSFPGKDWHDGHSADPAEGAEVTVDPNVPTTLHFKVHEYVRKTSKKGRRVHVEKKWRTWTVTEVENVENVMAYWAEMKKRHEAKSAYKKGYDWLPQPEPVDKQAE